MLLVVVIVVVVVVVVVVVEDVVVVNLIIIVNKYYTDIRSLQVKTLLKILNGNTLMQLVYQILLNMLVAKTQFQELLRSKVHIKN